MNGYNKVQTSGNVKEQEGHIRMKTSKLLPSSGNQILWTEDTKIKVYQALWKEKSMKKENISVMGMYGCQWN